MTKTKTNEQPQDGVVTLLARILVSEHWTGNGVGGLRT